MRWHKIVPGGSVEWDLIEVEAYNIDNWGRALAWCDGLLVTVPYRGVLELVFDGEKGVRHYEATGGRWHPEPARVAGSEHSGRHFDDPLAFHRGTRSIDIDALAASLSGLRGIHDPTEDHGGAG